MALWQSLLVCGMKRRKKRKKRKTERPDNAWEKGEKEKEANLDIRALKAGHSRPATGEKAKSTGL